MKTRIVKLLPGWRWVILALAGGLAVALAVPALGQTLTLEGSQWSLGRYVDSITFDGDGKLWAKPSGNEIISFKDSTLTVWTHGNSTVFGGGYQPIGVEAEGTDADRFAWAGGGAQINRLDTTNGQVVTWPLPGSGSACGDFVALDVSGNAWFGSADGRLARLNPSTNTLTEWPMPIAGSYCPSVISIDTSGDVWVCEAAIGRIGKLDPATNTVTEWHISGNTFGDCHARDSAGRIWFTRATAEILELNPGTNQLTIWPSFMGSGSVVGTVGDIGGGTVWFTEYMWSWSSGWLDKLDTATNSFMQFYVSRDSARPFLSPSGDIWTTSGATVNRLTPP